LNLKKAKSSGISGTGVSFNCYQIYMFILKKEEILHPVGCKKIYKK
jgi:hypothetical protein